MNFEIILFGPRGSKIVRESLFAIATANNRRFLPIKRAVFKSFDFELLSNVLIEYTSKIVGSRRTVEIIVSTKVIVSVVFSTFSLLE